VDLRFLFHFADDRAEPAFAASLNRTTDCAALRIAHASLGANSPVTAVGGAFSRFIDVAPATNQRRAMAACVP
jgi:hypothetical protein